MTMNVRIFFFQYCSSPPLLEPEPPKSKWRYVEHIGSSLRPYRKFFVVDNSNFTVELSTGTGTYNF